jgi:hypothetical protein
VKIFLIKYLLDFQSGNDREGESVVCDGEGGGGGGGGGRTSATAISLQ